VTTVGLGREEQLPLDTIYPKVRYAGKAASLLVLVAPGMRARGKKGCAVAGGSDELWPPSGSFWLLPINPRAPTRTAEVPGKFSALGASLPDALQGT